MQRECSLSPHSIGSYNGNVPPPLTRLGQKSSPWPQDNANRPPIEDLWGGLRFAKVARSIGETFGSACLNHVLLLFCFQPWSILTDSVEFANDVGWEQLPVPGLSPSPAQATREVAGGAEVVVAVTLGHSVRDAQQYAAVAEKVRTKPWSRISAGQL
eukprot:3848710-Pyramimonas_sp.AAC.1